jgi:hypothetical protein
MRTRSHGFPRKAALAVATLALGVLPTSPAGATTIVKAFDRSDNDFSFTYTAQGDIPVAASSAILKPGDKVSFFAYVRERPEAPEGRRLAAVLDLRLETSRPVRYDGTFAFIVKHENGTRVARLRADRSFTLRPKKGERREVVRLRFDLEPGRYDAFARFRGAEV